MLSEELQTYADEVAKQLGETKEQPVRQIELIVEHMGKAFTEKHLAETLKIEEKGGMKTEDGKRRRTIGGVFFYIVKGKLNAEQKQLIFPNSPQSGGGIKWDERMEHVASLLEKADDEHGQLRYVNVTLNGFIKDVIKKDYTVVTTIRHVHETTPLPKGVPQPPKEPVLYMVYMGLRQWEPVEKALQKNPNDRVIIEGSAFLDFETKTFAVLAQTLTTKQLEKQARKKSKKTPDAAATESKEQKKKPEKKEKAASPQAAKQDSKNAKAEKAQASANKNGASQDIAARLEKLHNAAQIYREKIASMEAEGKSSAIALTKRLLKNTEKEIANLEKKLN